MSTSRSNASFFLRTWSPLMAVAIVIGSPMVVRANLFTNGSLTGPTNTHSLVPPGWSNLVQGTTDTVSAAGHPFGPLFVGIGEFPYANSSDGGTFAWSADYFEASAGQPEGLGQIVGGLTVGQQYRITFEYTNLGLYDDAGNIATDAFGVGQNYASNGRWLTVADATPIDATPTVAFSPTFGTQTWQSRSLVFSATSASMQFEFVSDWVSGNGTHVGMGIDAINLEIVPEPSLGMLLLCGMLGLVGRRVPAARSTHV